VSVTDFPGSERPGALADGEAVLWRERRSPPFMEFGLAAAAVLVVGGLAARSIIVTPLTLVAAAAVVLLVRRFTAGHYLEDQLMTDRRVMVVPRVGPTWAFPLDEIDEVELRGTRATFTGGGQSLRFAFVRRHKALRRAIETGAPHISFEQRWDPNCAG
jgi:hypothetical protein